MTEIRNLKIINPTNICLDDYTNMIDKLLEKGNFSNKYKSYEKTENNIISFICFDIESDIITSSIVFKSIKYQGNLVFTYDKTSNKVLIKELPKYGSNSIPIFTSDILSIILDKLKKYISPEEVIIEFVSHFQKFALDSNLKNLLPQIEQNINYKRMCHIFTQMHLEEERIKQDVLAEKRKKDKEDAIKERVIAEKSIIYGIDKRDYEDYLDYLNAVNKRIVDVCDYKIKNIKRHIEANKRIYIELLKKNDKTHAALRNVLDDIQEGVYCWYDNHCYENVYNAIRDIINDTTTKPEITSQILEIYYAATYQYDTDLSNKESLISLLSSIRAERDWDECRYDTENHKEIKRRGKQADMYNSILGVKDYYGTEREEIINYKNPIFQDHRIVQKDFRKCVDVLFQIASLKRQLSYYETIKSNPDKALLSFQSKSDSWNSILNFPYWLRLGRDINRQDYYNEKFNLLMIKPGVKDIDLNDIRVFTRDNGKEFGATKVERLEYLKKLMQGDIDFSCDRIMITIPKSLNFESIIKLIDYAHDYGCKIQFVCETPDVATIIKEILFDRAITAYKQVSIVDVGYRYSIYRKIRNKYFKDCCFICVDPEYFRNFFLDTPTNKNFWHRYDYTGNYKYRKKNPASLDYMIDLAIYENTHEGVIDYERINKQVLGSYSSETLEEALLNIRLIDFIDDDEYHKLPKWIPECKGLDYYELEQYVDDNFPDKFYLDYRDREELYESEYDEEKDIQNEGEIYKKELKKDHIDDENGLPFNN